jgi:monoamine oxidase
MKAVLFLLLVLAFSHSATSQRQKEHHERNQTLHRLSRSRRKEDGLATHFPGSDASDRAHIRYANASFGTPRNDEISTDERDLQTTMFDAIIVGAGWAGLGAAKKLQGRNILVLEARRYVGGRSRTVSFATDNSTLTELGSGWIHGATAANPVFNIAQISGMGTIPSPFEGAYWSNVYGGTAPHRVANDEIDPLVESYEAGLMDFLDDYPDVDDTDMPLRTAANEYASQGKISGQKELVYEMTLDSEITQEYGASLEDLSRWWWNEDQSIAGGDVLIGRQGYSGAVNWYAQSIKSKIRTRARVTRIDWTTNVISVTYMQNGVTKVERARNVIVTVPLGVLKRNGIRFVPDLPAAKKAAISKLGSALLNKCILKWDDNTILPWPANIGWLERIAAAGQQGKWTEFFSLERDTGKKVLVAWSAGREAARVENLSNQQIQQEVMASLAAMFGSGAVPVPRELIVTRWLRDPLAGGSYSYYKVGSGPADRDQLAATLGGRVFFAGEATNKALMSTTHGALNTGLKAGQSVLNKLNARERRKYLRRGLEQKIG